MLRCCDVSDVDDQELELELELELEMETFARGKTTVEVSYKHNR
jgi:hypothetical protein